MRGKEKNKCTNLYEVVQGEEIKYIDEEGKKYSNLMSFRNNNTNENKQKRKYDRTSPGEDTGKEK